MTLEDILHNEELRNHEFPVTRDKIFLAHAGVCPLPRRVTAAMNEYIERAARDDQEEVFPAGRFREARNALGRLLQAQPEEIAFVGPTSTRAQLCGQRTGFAQRRQHRDLSG